MIFDLAQHKFQNTSGLELVGLPSRTTLGQEHAAEERVATEIEKKVCITVYLFGIPKLIWNVTANAVGSKTYILRSTLDPILIEWAAQTD